jgi:hypothetical protein
MRLLLNGTLPDEATLMTDDLVKQMIDKAKEGMTTKEAVIQALQVEDIPDEMKKTIIGEPVTKESVIQTLQVEDVPEVVKQKIIEDANVIPAVVQKFADGIIEAVKGDNGEGNTTGKQTSDVKQSANRQLYEKLHKG